MENIDGYTYRAKRVVSFPMDGGTQGHYSLVSGTGNMAAGAGTNAELFHFRWTAPDIIARILEFKVTGLRASTAFAVGAIDIDLYIARSWTASGTGGTFPVLSGNNQKLDTRFGTSLMVGQRVATTAPLGVGTKTLDTQPVGTITTHSSGGFSTATPIIGSIYLPTVELFKAEIGDCQSPIHLQQNEGIVLMASVPATGVWQLKFSMTWVESPRFRT